MLNRSVTGWCFILAVAAATAGSYGEARAAGFRRPPKPQLKTASIDGTISKVAGGIIYASNDKDQQPWTIELEQDTKVLVTGTAKLDFLKKGLLVKVDAQPDDKGLIKDKVSKLTIVTASTEDQPVMPDLGGKPKGKPGKPASSGDFKGTVGMIVGVHAGKLGLKIEKKVSEVEVAEDAKVEVSVDILTWVAKGDRIQATGMANPKTPGYCLAKSVSVTLSEPLTSGRKKAAKTDAKPADKDATAPKADSSSKSPFNVDDPSAKKKKKPADKPAPDDSK